MKVIIVGAGISGLTAAYYARRQGHDVDVYERCLNPGGVSTNWKRKGYLFEGGIHWLTGSSKRLAQFHDIYVETGALSKNNPIHRKDEIFTYRRDDVSIHLWRNADRLCDELLSVAPEDRKAIRRLYHDIMVFGKFYGAPQNFSEHMERLPRVFEFLWAVATSNFTSTEKYLKRFKNKYVHEALSSIINISQSATSLLGTLSGYHIGDNGFPEGGSSVMSRNMEARAKEMGVQFHYGKTIEKVCTAAGKVTGVMLDGEFIAADKVIVTLDTRTAIEKLIDVPLKDWWAKRLLKKKIESEQCMFMSFGVKADMDHYPENMRLHLDQPLEIGGETYDIIWLFRYGHKDGYAPEGCTSLTMLFQGDSYDYWKTSKQDGTYRAKKEEAIEKVKVRLAELIPETAGNIEATDLATPVTYERYCGNYRGGYMTVWRAGTFPLIVPAKCSIKGLLFAGQRALMMGGLPIAAQSGKAAGRATGKAK